MAYQNINYFQIGGIGYDSNYGLILGDRIHYEDDVDDGNPSLDSPPPSPLGSHVTPRLDEVYTI